MRTVYELLCPPSDIVFTRRFGVVPPPTAEDAMKQALLAVVQVWLDRLQAMAVVVSPSP